VNSHASCTLRAKEKEKSGGVESSTHLISNLPNEKKAWSRVSHETSNQTRRQGAGKRIRGALRGDQVPSRRVFGGRTAKGSCETRSTRNDPLSTIGGETKYQSERRVKTVSLPYKNTTYPPETLIKSGSNIKQLLRRNGRYPQKERTGA